MGRALCLDVEKDVSEVCWSGIRFRNAKKHKNPWIGRVQNELTYRLPLCVRNGRLAGAYGTFSMDVH